MAHFKRGKCRHHSSPHVSKRSTGSQWLSNWPRWWDIIHHTKPRRRAESKALRAVFREQVDPDNVAWPLDKKPHIYYW